MKGIKIDFGNGEAVLVLGETVEKEASQVQNMLVNIATEFPAPVLQERGTQLLKSFARTGFVPKTFAQHAANFAAIDTLFFCKTFNTEAASFTDIALEAPENGHGDLTFSLAVSFNGATIQTTDLSI